jgi:hypothetical protein
MLIDKAEIERVKRGNELVAFIRSRGVALRQRGKQMGDLRASIGFDIYRDEPDPLPTRTRRSEVSL